MFALRPRIPRQLSCFGLLLLAAATGTPTSSHAALLVYEGFNGYTTNAALSTVTPNGNTVGLSTANSWDSSGDNRADNPNTKMKIIDTGLTFSTHTVSGGAVQFNTTTSVASAQITSSLGSATTLYSSYLINFASRGSGSGNGSEARVSSNDDNLNSRFRAMGDSRISADSKNLGADFVLTSPTPSVQDSTSSLSLGVNYMIIGKASNVGVALSTGAPGTMEVWALTVAQYDLFMAAGIGDAYLEANKNNTSLISAYAIDTHTAGTFGFNSGDFVQFVNAGSSGTFDELRFSTSLVDVVPEPSRAVLVGASLLGLALRRQRRSVI